HGKVEYRIDFLYHSHGWMAWVRYSALRELVRECAGSTKLEAFPPKSSMLETIMHSDDQLGFVDQRRHALNTFLRGKLFPDRASFEILVNASPELSREVLEIPASLVISTDGVKKDRAAVLAEA